MDVAVPSTFNSTFTFNYVLEYLGRADFTEEKKIDKPYHQFLLTKRNPILEHKVRWQSWPSNTYGVIAQSWIQKCRQKLRGSATVGKTGSVCLLWTYLHHLCMYEACLFWVHEPRGAHNWNNWVSKSWLSDSTRDISQMINLSFTSRCFSSGSWGRHRRLFLEHQYRLLY